MTHPATTSIEKIDAQCAHLVERVKELVHEGNVRRIIVKDSHGKTLLKVPVTVGVVVVLVAPTALVADYSPA